MQLVRRGAAYPPALAGHMLAGRHTVSWRRRRKSTAAVVTAAVVTVLCWERRFQ